jgi:hypothetical protein
MEGGSMTIADAKAIYRAAHWGYEADTVITVDHPAAISTLTEMGWLDSLEVRDRARSPKEEQFLDFAVDGRPQGRIAFDAPPATRLFVILTGEGRKLGRELFDMYSDDLTDTQELAERAGGRQTRYAGRKIKVACVGLLWAVTYQTHKKGDPPVRYRHRMGELGGLSPYLGVDHNGYMYVCGGTYSVEPRGIVY